MDTVRYHSFELGSMFIINENLLRYGFIRNRIYTFNNTYANESIYLVYLKNKKGMCIPLVVDLEVRIIGRGLLIEKWH